MDEATAFLDTLDRTAPTSPTACARWTAHELVAHLTAGAAEMAELTEAVTTGRGERATRDFSAREAPYAAMADDDLRNRLVVEAIRLSTAIEALGAPGAPRTVPFAGRRLSASELVMHGRSEAALHRWDLAGGDDVSDDLLGQPELTAHAVEVLNTMLGDSPEAVTTRTTAAAITKLRARFAAPGQLDVVLVVDAAGARLELDEPRTTWGASTDPGARLLALWGRRSPTRPISWRKRTAHPEHWPPSCGDLAPARSPTASRPPSPPCPKSASQSTPCRAGCPYGRGLRALLPGRVGPRCALRRLVRDGGDVDPHLLPAKLSGTDAGTSKRPFLPELGGGTTSRVPCL